MNIQITHVIVLGVFLLSSLSRPAQTETTPVLTDDEKGRLTTATETLKQEGSRILSAASEVAGIKAEEYKRKVQLQLKQLQPKLDELKSKADSAGLEAKAEIQENLRSLELRRAEIMARLDDVSTSSGEALQDMQNGINHAVKDLRESFDKARSRFR